MFMYRNPNDSCFTSGAANSKAEPKTDHKQRNNRREEHKYKGIGQFGVKEHSHDQKADRDKQTDSCQKLRTLPGHFKKRCPVHVFASSPVGGFSARLRIDQLNGPRLGFLSKSTHGTHGGSVRGESFSQHRRRALMIASRRDASLDVRESNFDDGT
jgi:hypothetical protein